MSGNVTQACPGCTRPKPIGELCCDPCWSRIPTRIPGWDRPWRTSLRTSRQVHDWGDVERIHDALRAWLAAHPEGGTR